MQGGGVINLGRLGAESLAAKASGGSVVIGAPSQKADLALDGSAQAILLTRPPMLKTDIIENGRLIDASPAAN
jgi:hypothetical protein